MSIRMIMTTEPVMVDGVVTTYHRAQIWEGTKHPHVEDSTGLYDTEAGARKAGEELLSLYDTQANFATVLVGYMTYESAQEMRENRGVGELFHMIRNQPVGQHVVPVYTKVNDHFHTRMVISGKP